MTYAESRAQVYSPAANYTVVPPPRTPVGPSMDQQRKSKMKNGANSLDYWNKAEDEKSGITYYYSRHNIQFPQRMLNRSQPPPSSARGRPTLVPQRFPPFPPPQDVNINIMSPQPPPPPPAGIYKNVPAMPRAKLNKEFETRRSSNGDGNVVWGGKKEEYNDDGVGTSANTPMNPYSANDKKRNTARRKPRWTRCMQTLFCCVTPPREIEKIQSNNRTSTSSHSNGRSTPTSAANAPIQLITQVHRDGTVTGLPTTPLAQNGSGDTVVVDNRQPNDLNSIVEKPLLPPLAASDSKKKCLVIDLDETLVHSSFKPVKNPDFVIPVEIDGVEHQVYVLKRPYVDEFLARVGEIFECILFTASLAKYADPVADLLDKKRIFRGRLFREACVFHKGNYVKDLGRLGRDLNHCLIIDNSPASYAFHPENAVPVTTWFDDPGDRELLDIIPALETLNQYESVYDALRPEEGPMSESLLEHCSC